jgi:hypothetical protein
MSGTGGVMSGTGGVMSGTGGVMSGTGGVMSGTGGVMSGTGGNHTGGAGGTPLGGSSGSGSATGTGGSATGGMGGASSIAGLDPLLQISQLPVLRTGNHVLATGSTDPQQTNFDYSNYLGTSSGEKVLLDVLGPGAVFRFWHTEDPSQIASSTAQYKFYLDGETTARLTVNLKDMWVAGTGPFVSPLTVNQAASSGGAVTYLPIRFAQSLKITEAGTPAAKDYYNIDYVLYPAGTAVTSFTGQEDRSAQDALWKSVGTNPNGTDPTDMTVTGTAATTAPGATSVLANITGPRELTELRVTIPGLGSQNALGLLSSVRLQIAWDGETTPSVDAPLGNFFATGALNGPVRALPIGWNNGTAYCYFPMPFAKSAQVRLYNGDSAQSLASVSYSVTSRAFTGDFNQVGYFKVAAQTNQSGQLFSATGSGQIVGVTLTSPNRSSSLEANDQLYIDGARSASIVGTGTEDYFDGGWYFIDGAFTNPLTGAPAMPSSDSKPFTMYRFMLGDAIPFRSSAQLNWGSDLQAVVYYYSSTKVRLTQTDQVTVSDSSSVSQHGYQTVGATAVSLTSGWFSAGGSTQMSGFSVTGQSTFNATVDPTNQGIVLRRAFDAADANQRADVYIDDVMVGTWYVAGSFPTQSKYRFKESDFSVPATATAGKSTVSVRLMIKSAVWDEYGYKVLSQTP